MKFSRLLLGKLLWVKNKTKKRLKKNNSTIFKMQKKSESKNIHFFKCWFQIAIGGGGFIIVPLFDMSQNPIWVVCNGSERNRMDYGGA